MGKLVTVKFNVKTIDHAKIIRQVVKWMRLKIYKYAANTKRLVLRRKLTTFADRLGGIENGRVWEREQAARAPMPIEEQIMIDLIQSPAVTWLNASGDNRSRPTQRP